MSRYDPPYPVDLWVCSWCGIPQIIEDGGFYPEGFSIKNGCHPTGFLIECWYCCHDEYTRLVYSPTLIAKSVWETRKSVIQQEV